MSVPNWDAPTIYGSCWTNGHRLKRYGGCPDEISYSSILILPCGAAAPRKTKCHERHRNRGTGFVDRGWILAAGRGLGLGLTLAASVVRCRRDFRSLNFFWGN